MNVKNVFRPRVRPTGFWSLLSPADRERLNAYGSHRQWSAGEVMRASDHTPSTALVIRSGMAQERRPAPTLEDGDSILLRLYRDGDLIGAEAAAPRLSFRSNGIVVSAVTAVYGMILTAERFRRFLVTNPGAALAVSQVLSARITDTDLLRPAAAERGVQRIAGQLGELCHQYGHRSADGISLPMTQSDLASLLGTSRESLVRVLRVLREHGAVTITRGCVTVCSIATLQRLARQPSRTTQDEVG